MTDATLQSDPQAVPQRSSSGRLAGQVVIVTGGTSSLGAGIAVRCAQEGADVGIVGRDATRGGDVEQATVRAGGRARFATVDLRDPESCEAAVREIADEFGPISTLVNCAKSNDSRADASRADDIDDTAPVAWATGDGTVVDASIEAWPQIFGVNVFGVAYMCRAAIPSMIERGWGSIVNVSSRVAERGTPALAVYSASKGAVNALTRSIAVDFGAYGIRCNAIAAGYIEHADRDAVMPEERRQFFAAQHLTPRLGRIDDITNAVVYLASRESDFVTGEVLFVDGGGASARGRVVG